MIQFRLAEALNVLSALTPAAIPGLFIGCLLANALNPLSLGPVDIILGSLATLLAAAATWRLSRRLNSDDTQAKNLSFGHSILIFAPGVLFNGLIVGTYLPFLRSDGAKVTLPLIAACRGWISLSQSLVIYLIGWPLYQALQKTHLIRLPSRA
jgi:uncharacterized membrane protein